MSVCMCAFVPALSLLLCLYVYGLAYENHAFYMNVLVLLLLLNIIVFAGRYSVTVVALTLCKIHSLSLSLCHSHSIACTNFISPCNAVIFPLVIIVAAAH